MLFAGATLTAAGQNIRPHYVSKAEADGVIYHTFPVTLFEHPEAGDLTFDITYKEHREGRATLNFTCRMARADEGDSVRFVSGGVVLAGGVWAGSRGVAGWVGAQPARQTANISGSMGAARCFMAFPFFPPGATSARRRVGPTGRPRRRFGLPSF